MASVHLFTEQTDVFTTGWRPWCPLRTDAWRRVRRCEDPPMARTQDTSAGRREAEAGGRNRAPVLPEGRLGGHVACGVEPRVHAGPWRCTGDPGLGAEHFWADHSVSGVLWGEVCAPLSLLLPQLQRGGVRGGHSSLERTEGSSLWDRAVRTLSNFS